MNKPNIVTIEYPDGNKVSFIPHPMFDNNGEINLVSPYFQGDGKSFSPFIIYHNSPALPIGTILDSRIGNSRCIIISTDVVEDFFENIEVATCSLITDDPIHIMDTSVRTLACMRSAKAETLNYQLRNLNAKEIL